uniref:Endoglucanase n=1 Tax=uncultured bacterium contig00009 TaxID=1181501 RepID=A0A806KPW8_9BACT|nr:cellulose 1,4-beta-cellobiosidase [uncultured bacterium contig00009]
MKPSVRLFMSRACLVLAFGFLSLNLYAQPPQIAINQVGFYPGSPKQAIVVGMPAETRFSIVSEKGDTVFEGQLSDVRKSKNSSLVTRVADFSGFNKAGKYRVVSAGLSSPVFTISDRVHDETAKALIKGFYYQRVSMPLEERYAGIWARPAGHPDDKVLVHSSAATEQRPEGTVISSPGGWYDAGDYNKYIVNSGITVGTLLSAYEDFPEYFAKQNLNIPESGNGAPDILNEALYNLRWMLTMQDPHDGGVYNKLTNAEFDGMVMPGVTKDPRYVVQKGTAATLDFAAVMAQAARIYKKYPKVFPGLSDSFLEAAKKAWQWALKNPDMEYNQFAMNRNFKPEIQTGGYGDRRFTDEWFWAAAELYATTSDKAYAEAIEKYFPEKFSIPTWNSVDMLGVYTLFRTGNAKMMPETARKQLLDMADAFVKSMEDNAFAVVMGQSPRDFIWGSNSEAANQGILLINAYILTRDKKYLDAALSNANYLLGQNATGYSFVTGIGAKQVMHPHHRPSEADGIVAPVPGLLSGGPNPGKPDRCETYLYSEPETSFTDDVCSYASNEIAINWNAPAVYLFNAIENLTLKYTVRGGTGPV